MTNPHDPALPYYEAVELDGAGLHRMPQVYVNHAELACTPDQLFDVFEDATSWSKWALGIRGVEWTSPKPYGPGTTRTVRMAGGLEIYETFFEWTRGKQMAFSITGATQPVWRSFGENYDVVDLGAGRCTLTWTVAYEPRDTFRTIHFLVRPVMAFALGQYMRRLEKYVAKRVPRGQAAAAG